MEDVISRPAREALGDTGRRCTATNRSGHRCGLSPIAGGFVCHLHGGKNPIVVKTARERLLAMVDPALDALLRFLRTAPPCEHCGRSDADRDPVVLRAAQIVLDRTGHHAGLDIKVEAPKGPPFADVLPWIPSERVQLMRVWLAEAQTAKDGGLPDAFHVENDVIEGAVLIDETDAEVEAKA